MIRSIVSHQYRENLFTGKLINTTKYDFDWILFGKKGYIFYKDPLENILPLTILKDSSYLPVSFVSFQSVSRIAGIHGSCG